MGRGGGVAEGAPHRVRKCHLPPLCCVCCGGPRHWKSENGEGGANTFVPGLR